MTKDELEEKIDEWIRDGILAERYKLDPKTGRYERVLEVGELGRLGPLREVSVKREVSVEEVITAAMAFEERLQGEIKQMIKEGFLVERYELDPETGRYEQVLELTELGWREAEKSEYH
jgi:MOSC domain-containing protein YiiM